MSMRFFYLSIPTNESVKIVEKFQLFTRGFGNPETYFKTLDENKLLMLGQVNHSQSLNEKAVKVWILTRKDGEIVFTICTYTSGLFGLCPHLGAILFALETGSRLAEESCTTLPNTWLPTCTKKAPLKIIFDLDLSSKEETSTYHLQRYLSYVDIS